MRMEFLILSGDFGVEVGLPGVWFGHAVPALIVLGGYSDVFGGREMSWVCVGADSGLFEGGFGVIEVVVVVHVMMMDLWLYLVVVVFLTHAFLAFTIYIKGLILT